jgi:ssRNA-specific RNase YbeY (16S rRNA maturation enzyme)
MFLRRWIYKINVEYLDHDTLTDIISFDYSMGNELHGDISFLSKELKTTLLTLMFLWGGI